MSTYENLSETQKFACRVIADHARSTAFSIADGILPGNEGRNYVLRKIMRRAIYHGREHLGYTDPFFYKVCDFVVDEMQAAFPELGVQRGFIGKMVRLEEERFGNTMTVGLKKFQELFNRSSFTELLKTSQEHFLGRLQGLNRDTLQLLGDRIEEIKHLRTARNAGEQDLNHLYARITFHNKIPPSEVEYILKSEYPNDPFDFEVFVSQLAGLARSSTFLSEKAIAETFLDSDFTPEKFQQFRDELDALYLQLFTFRSLAELYDTYGTPKDLIRVLLEERDINIGEDEFTNLFDEALVLLQKQSGIGQTQRKSEISPIYAEMLERVGANKFHGYEVTRLDAARVVGILDGDKQVDVLNEGQQGSVILDQTPFYAESGGQVGDTGVLVGLQPENHPVGEAPTPLLRKEGSSRATVADTYSPVAGLIIHKVKVDAGSIKAGDTVTAIVDEEKRDATRRNHTATHLVHAALKEVLGTHVKQAGSVVAPNYLRFDFTHYQPMTAAEIREVEDLVNRYVLQNEPVTTNMMSLEDAMRSGAVAMFGEKYGSEVRVLRVGDGKFSMELCGGTHVRATGDIGSFKITSDEAIASGVRRIRAITGFDAFERFREDEVLIDRSLEALKTQRDNLPAAIERLQEEVKRTRKEIEELKLKIATGAAGNGSAGGDEAREIAGVKVLGKVVDGLDANGQRQLSDTLLARLKSGVVVLGRKDEGKASIIVRVSADLTDKIKAGNIVKEIVPLLGGRGGGRPDMAEGGGPDANKLSEAIDAAYASIEKMAS